METANFQYPGDELVLFQHARNWKKYFSEQLQPFIKGRVLEAGAGIGSTTILLHHKAIEDWLLLEPDADMSRQLLLKIREGQLPSSCRIQTGTIDDVNEKFDCIIYIDVLEHIEKDQAELAKAADHLMPGGHLLVLSPAFQHLFSPFDKAIGHYRRYTKKTLQAVSPPLMELLQCRYFDSTGYMAALANKLILHQQYPSEKQVLFWDKWLVPVSRLTDKLLFHLFGKSIIAIWKKSPAG